MTTREQRLRHDDGFPAFPVDPRAHECSDAEYMALRGMSLRDYFAAHAPDMPIDWWGGDRSRKALIAWRWTYADAMLKERKEPGQ